MSVLLQYRVSCKGEENESDRYAVKEFFRVRYIADAQKTYLLDYDRTMDQIFDATKKVLNEKGIILGIAPTNLSYKVNKDGRSYHLSRQMNFGIIIKIRMRCHLYSDLQMRKIQM